MGKKQRVKRQDRRCFKLARSERLLANTGIRFGTQNRTCWASRTGWLT